MTLDQMTRAAHQFRRQGHDDKFLELMERAAAMFPQKQEIKLDLGLWCLRQHEHASAERWFEQVVSVSAPADKLRMLEFIGFQYQNHFRFELAEHCLERACGLPGASADTFARLGELHERCRQIDKAREAAGRALAIDGGNAMALLLVARLERSANRIEAGEKIVRGFLQNARSQEARVRGWYELGANLDRQGRHEEAMSAFVSAKAGMLAVSRPAMAEYLELRKKGYQASRLLLEQTLREGGDAEGLAVVRRHRIAAICGHPRSGTTLLEQILDSHPATVSAEETLVFHDAIARLAPGIGTDHPETRALERATPDALNAARQWYVGSMEKFLGQPIGQRLLIDKNPGITGQIPHLLKLFPKARVIVAIRDPRDVCLSCFMQPLAMNPVSCSYLTLEGTANEYAGLMGFWLGIKPLLKESAMELRYEDVVANPEACARGMLAFLGLDWDPAVLQFHEHARQKLVRSPSYQAVANPITSGAVGRWKNYEKFMGPILRQLEPFVAAFGYQA